MKAEDVADEGWLEEGRWKTSSEQSAAEEHSCEQHQIRDSDYYEACNRATIIRWRVQQINRPHSAGTTRLCHCFPQRLRSQWCHTCSSRSYIPPLTCWRSTSIEMLGKTKFKKINNNLNKYFKKKRVCEDFFSRQASDNKNNNRTWNSRESKSVPI